MTITKRSLTNFQLLFFLLLVSTITLVSCGKSNSTPKLIHPTITDFNPIAGSVGDTVTIIGTNFSSVISNNIVKFNPGAIATVIFASPTQLKVIVPGGSAGTIGKISITISGQTVMSNADFTANKSNAELILGKWAYLSSETVDSFAAFTGNTNKYNYFPGSYMNQFFIDFIDSSRLYITRNAFGLGVFGAFYFDTVSYKIAGNNIYLSFPSGNVPGWADVTFTNYPAYTDSIGIKTLSSNNLIITQNYHFQHFWLYNGEYKQSVDTLFK